jgi:hypothetical protein
MYLERCWEIQGILLKSFIAKFTFQNDLTPKIIHSDHLLSHGPSQGFEPRAGSFRRTLLS